MKQLWQLQGWSLHNIKFDQKKKNSVFSEGKTIRKNLQNIFIIDILDYDTSCMEKKVMNQKSISSQTHMHFTSA